jgi:hypothetical protein
MMRIFHFSLAAVLALAIVFPSLAAEKPRPAETNPASQAKKVWTNEDMGQLRARGLITTFSAAPEMNAEAPPAPPEPATIAPRIQDPAWYADQASVLQADLDARETALHDAQAGLAQAKQRITQPGIAMDKGNLGITPESGIAILEAQVRAVRDQLDGLSDLARQNNIPPGDLHS